MKNGVKLAGYITNLRKYNEGDLIGKWIEFPITDEDAAAALARIGVSDQPDENGEYYEEYFFTDWDSDIYGIAAELGEYLSIDEVNEIVEQLDAYGVELAEAVIEAYSLDDLLESEPEDYILYNASDDEELGEAIAEQTGILDRIPVDLQAYFDFEAYGRDYIIDSAGDFVDAGFIECIK